LISVDGGWERTAACCCLAPGEISRRKTGRREQACWLLCAARVKQEWERAFLVHLASQVERKRAQGEGEDCC
jgi:hypothetical protein